MSLRTLVFGALIVSVTACSKTVTWTEEVKLSAGQTLIIERETRHIPGGGEIFRSSGWRPELYIIRFKHEYPQRYGLLQIEWRTTKWDAERVMDPEIPLVLDIDLKGIPFIITKHGLRGFCYEYLRYAYRDGGWYEDPLPAEFEPIPANLSLAAAGLDLPKKVTLDLKREVSADIGYRKRLKQIGPKQSACGA
jgi:hypothetical protein